MKKFINAISPLLMSAIATALVALSIYMFTQINQHGNTEAAMQLNNFLCGIFGGECLALGVLMYAHNIAEATRDLYPETL